VLGLNSFQNSEDFSVKQMKLVFMALGLMFSAFPSAGTAQEGGVTPNLTTKKTVLQAQRRLRELGYDAGVADGAMGARTSAALKKFQLDHGLPGSGALDQKTMDALNGPNAPTKAQAAPIGGPGNPLKKGGGSPASDAAAHVVRIVITPLTPDYGHNATIDATDYASIASNLSHAITSQLPAGYSVSDKAQEASNITVNVQYSNDLSYADFPQARMYHVSIDGDVALTRNGTTVVTKHFSSGRTEAMWPYLKDFSVEAFKSAIGVSGYDSAVGEIMNRLKGLDK
jgi:hypothetical protein